MPLRTISGVLSLLKCCDSVVEVGQQDGATSTPGQQGLRDKRHQAVLWEPTTGSTSIRTFKMVAEFPEPLSYSSWQGTRQDELWAGRTHRVLDGLEDEPRSTR